MSDRYLLPATQLFRSDVPGGDAEYASCPICDQPVDYYDLDFVTWCESCAWMGTGQNLLDGDRCGIFLADPITGEIRKGHINSGPLGADTADGATA